ncbi:glycogen synthase kinase binding protein [Anoplopoma fimbria]|uniref:glycogen synthase kinase binding protein n=1 Tax=Anoplopoma fimbria TaxID=229290 RepID=UPI0023EAC453|nr:glycogen synthase kinase binding protein [Anoplopoma fimbria]
MPCRKEDYIFLEQSVSVDSKEVDALVSRIGEALQLHGGGGSVAGTPQQRRCGRLRGHGGGGGGGGRGGRGAPYCMSGRKRRVEVDVEEHDPHRLLQELLLSGNLVKEAVRRLQFSPADCAGCAGAEPS